MSISDTSKNPMKANIQDVEIHLCKINNNGQKSDRASLCRRQTEGAAALPTKPKKGYAKKRTIINVDRQIEASIVEKNMHDRMTPDKS